MMEEELEFIKNEWAKNGFESILSQKKFKESKISKQARDKAALEGFLTFDRKHKKIYI